MNGKVPADCSCLEVNYFWGIFFKSCGIGGWVGGWEGGLFKKKDSRLAEVTLCHRRGSR